MKLIVKGQITVPKEIRKKFGIYPEMEVQVTESKGEIVIRKSSDKSPLEQVRWILKGKTPWRRTDDFMEEVRGRLE